MYENAFLWSKSRWDGDGDEIGTGWGDALGPKLVQLVDARDALDARVRLAVLQGHRVLLLGAVRHVPVVDAPYERRDELRAHVARRRRLRARTSRTKCT